MMKLHYPAEGAEKENWDFYQGVQMGGWRIPWWLIIGVIILFFILRKRKAASD